MPPRKVRLSEDKEQKARSIVKRSSHGLGLFALEDVKRGTLVAEYSGPVITRQQANEKGGRYLFETSDSRVIDGTTRRNLGRYVNHQCKPNCEIDIKRGRIFIRAKKRIKEGEEFGYDYGKEYWKEYIQPQGCMCWSCLEK